MTRFIPIAALALAAAACADQSTAPSSSLQPRTASNYGDPPPPPGRSDGFEGSAFFDAEEVSSDISAAQPEESGPSAAAVAVCEASLSFTFKWSYLLNPVDNTAFLHIGPDNGSRQVTIRQTNNTPINAQGVISGPGFTFKISAATGGSIIDSELRTPNSVTVDLIGTLTTATASCQATATLIANLIPVIIE